MLLNHMILGEGKPVVILHGLFGMLDNWVSFGKKIIEFDNRFSVLLVDLRNHGKSFHHSEMNYNMMAHDVQQLLKNYSIEKCSMIGHSMGGKVVMQFAGLFYEMIEKICILDISPRAYRDDNFRFLINQINKCPLQNTNSRKEIDEFFFNAGLNKNLIQLLQKNIIRTEKGSFSWKFNSTAITNNIKNILDFPEQIESYIEALFIKGEKSDYICNADVDIIKKSFPNSTLIVAPNSEHWLHVDNPDFTFNSTFKFLTQRNEH